MTSNDRKTLLTAVAVSSLLAASVGILTGKALFPARPIETIPAEAKEDHAGDTPRIDMTAERVAADGIQVVSPVHGGFDAAIPVQAAVVATPNGAAILAARADGAIVRLDKRLGDPVAAGEVIATIESRDAAAISAEHSAAAARAIAARQALARERQLFDARITARQDLEAAQAEAAIAEAELRRASSASAAAGVGRNGRTLAVTSPISGRITAASATLGAYVTVGAELFRVADPARVEVQAALPAADAPRVKPGDPAQIETTDGPVSAVVRSVTPSLDTESRSATAVLSLAAPTRMLAPGQALRARIMPRGGSPALSGGFAAPEEAVQSLDGVDVVFIRTRDGFQPRQVRLGRRAGGQAEILAGVHPGERIASKGAFLLKAELGKREAEH